VGLAHNFASTHQVGNSAGISKVGENKQLLIANVCALHEQSSHLVKLVEKIQKCKFEFRKARLSVIIFPEGARPLRAE
jgi:hypothetical protein